MADSVVERRDVLDGLKFLADILAELRYIAILLRDDEEEEEAD